MKINSNTVSFSKILKIAGVDVPSRLVLHSATFADDRKFNRRTVLKVPARTLKSTQMQQMLNMLLGPHTIKTQYNRNGTRTVGASIRYNMIG